MNTEQKSALIVIDYLNEMVDPKGKLAAKGYADFVVKHATLQRVSNLISSCRNAGDLIVYVKVGFSPSYIEHPENSPLFGAARKFGALQLGTWATDFHEIVEPATSDVVIIKHRVSAFYGTALDTILKNNGVKNVKIAGVATDLAVESAARDAHDRDYLVTIVSDCCGAANDEDHDNSLKTLSKIAKVVTLEELNA